MPSKTPPDELQVIDPQETLRQREDYVDPLPPEDRILSPQETENFFKTGSIKTPSKEVVEQAEMVGNMLATEAAAAEGKPQTLPHLPGDIPPKVAAQAVQMTQQQGQPTPQEPLQPLAQQVPGAPPATKEPAAPPQQPAQSPQEAALAAQVKTLMQQVGNLSSQLQQVQSGALTQAQQQKQAQDLANSYNFQIPAEYQAALDSENPTMRAQALAAIINGVAQTVHKQTLQDVDRRIEGVQPVIQQRISEAQQQAEIKNDMYGTYPELSNMMEQVAAVAMQMQNQGLTNGQWSADLRDSIAERLAPLVPGLAEKVQQIRGARYGQVQQPQPQQQLLPQVYSNQALPPGVAPMQVVGGAHVRTAPQQGPMLVRDAYGNISQVYPQQSQQGAGPQARPGMQGQVNPELQDIWATLGYTR